MNKEEFNLSEKRQELLKATKEAFEAEAIGIEDVFIEIAKQDKEFIRLLKENFRYRESKHQKLDLNIIELMIDKLAGDKLT